MEPWGVSSSQTRIILNLESNVVEYRVGYFLYGHDMQFIEGEAVKIGTEVLGADLGAVTTQNLIAIIRWSRPVQVVARTR